MATILTTFGRAGLASLFLLGAFYKATDPAGWSAELQSVGLPGALIWGVIAFEALGGAALLHGGRPAVAAGLAFAVYILPINALFYPFWATEGDIARLQASAFFKNVALIGALLHVAGREATPAR
ncbi:DoxX family membrane protein [Jannaschia formosa]|uniref:DoxX family membrane protein n=1 Tax=Jannaschia formosa TaxID=2259592 RepID=UPI000E1C2E9A|nr:DoxX family membrane protein [Jannaschia formosa]TFL17886.1 DoxX family membrane protein [Jannaschia formosa]